MKKNPRAWLPLLVLLPLAAASDWAGRPGGEKPHYGPKAGTVLIKHVVVENELELEDSSMEVDGRDVSDMAGQVEVAMKAAMKLSVTDVYEALGEGRPTKLKRSFEEISSTSHTSVSSPVMGSREHDVPMESKLEGSTVVFSWDEDDSAYRVTFDGDQKGDEDLLEGLEEDLDLRGFLPTSEVAEGDSWKVPAEAVKAALAPGGDVKLRAGSGGDPMSGMGQFSQNDMVGELEGEFEAVYDGARDEDGTRVAVIKLRIEARSAQDMTERLDEIMEEMKGELPEGLDMEISAIDTEYELDAEGELLWNLETGLAHALHLSGEVRMIVDSSMSMKMGDQEQSMESSQTFAGNQSIALTIGD
jgi:hypothetical protein